MPRWTVVLSMFLTLGAQDLSKLPDWARPQAEASLKEVPPDADAWVLLDRTEVAYAGDGEVRTHRYRLVRVLGERGVSEGIFALRGLGGGASKVKKLKGWNLRPDGELVKLDTDHVAAVSGVSDEDFSSDVLTAAELPRVAKGSLVAFESLQTVQHPLGPVEAVRLLERLPVRRWELEVGKKEGWFTNLKQVEVLLDLRRFSTWIKDPEYQPGQRVAASNLAALPKDEGAHPAFINMLPTVVIRFLDPDLKQVPDWRTWNGLSAWECGQFLEKAVPGGVADLKMADKRGSLERLLAWMDKEISYKQVYLSPERGWVPENSLEVVRRHYGDCKDLSALLIGEAKALGFDASPVLARIMDGYAELDEPPHMLFNHVISAIKLDQSWGLPAEVETPEGRFLLVDPTDRLTPFGKLGHAHRGHQVMICRPKQALWVKVPDAGIQGADVEAGLEGQVSLTGRLDAVLTLHEQGDAWRLRSTTLLGGVESLKLLVATEVVNLPPTGKLEILGHGNPLDLDKPFEVRVKVEHPEGFKTTGSEGVLVPWAVKIVPPQAQKQGTPRQYPVEIQGLGRLSYNVSLRMPRMVTPLLPSLELDTARCHLHWSCSVTPEEQGARVRLRMEKDDKDARWPYEDRAKGVAELKRDRVAMNNLLEEGFTFKLLP